MISLRPAVVPIVVLGFLAIQGAVAFGIVYFAARLAIRHERRNSNS